ncbi:MAG: hypothetical protein IPM39_14825 [Chloroflexi bacterium]|nr:hypothetical protein [Chloroflexota bacterium]
MNTFRMIATLTFVFSLLAAALTGNWVVTGLLVVASLMVLVPWLVNKYLWVRVPALSTGLVYNVETKAFSRFLLPGRHWLRPLEHVQKMAPIAPSFVSGECGRAQTNGGVTVAAKWSLAYCLNPTAVDEELQPNVANMLLKSIEPLLHTHVNNCITYLFDQHTVETVCDQGARQRLERELRGLVAERLAPFGVQTYRVILKSIVLPAEVMAAVEAAHKQELLAHSEARALERLHQAVSKFSDNDMERLLQLRQLQELGQHGVTLHVPTYAVMSAQPQPAVNHWQAGSVRRPNGHFHKPMPTDQPPDPLMPANN